MSEGILKPALQLTLFSLLGIVLGFLNQLILAYYFGTGSSRDAYFAASVIPTYVNTVFIGSIGAIFLSNYINTKTSSNKTAAQFLSSSLNFCLIVLLVISICGAIFSKQILSISAPGLTGKQYLLANTILKILFPTIIFQGLISLLTSVYQSNSKFLLPSLPAIITPIVSLIILCIARAQLGIVSLAWGTLLGYFISFLLLFLPILRSGTGFDFSLKLKNPDLKMLLIYAYPLIASNIIFRFNSVWERMLASKLPVGAMSYLGYANQILILLSTITTGGVATVFFPLLSKYWADNDKDGLKECFRKGINLLLLVTLPSISLLILLRVNVIHIIFQRGAFTASSTIAVSNTIAILMGAYFFQSLGSLIFRAFYFMNKTILASLIGIFEIACYITFSSILIYKMGYLGLALALSLSAGCNMLLTIFFVNRITDFIDRRLLASFFKIFISSVCAFVAIFYIKNLLVIDNLILATCCYTLLFGLLFFILTYSFKITEVKLLFSLITNRSNKSI